MIWRFLRMCFSVPGAGRPGSHSPGGPPGRSQRPQGFQGGPVGDPQGDPHPGAFHLVFGQRQEVVGGDAVVAKTSRTAGGSAVVVGGPGGGVVAQVGGQADRHGSGPDGAALPLQEEGPGDGATAQQAEGVGMDRARPSPVAEMPRRPVGRVQLDATLPAQGAGLAGQGRDEGVDGGGVVDVSQELPAPAAGDVAPVRRSAGVPGRDAPPLLSPRPPRSGPGGPAGPVPHR